MLTIFYPLVNSKYKDSLEFKYSLRSIDKFVKEDFKVVVVGYKPAWLKNVEYIPFKDSLNTFLNKYNKLLLMTNKEESFLWMHDDLFLLADFDKTSREKIYDIGSFPEKFGDSPLEAALRRDRNLLRTKNLSELNYLTHLPKMINSTAFLKMAQELDLLNRSSIAYENLYYNYIGCESQSCLPIKLALYTDRLFEPSQAENKLFVSINDKGRTEEFINFLKNVFPKKSRFEK